MPLVGHCNCKAVTITIADPPSGSPPHSTFYCHCTTCRRQSGASGTYIVVADEDQVKIDDPKNLQKTWIDNLTDSGKPLKRQFCGECGCPLTSITPIYAGKTIVKMGLFDTIPDAAAEVYCRNKQPWEPDYGIPALQGSS